MLLKEAYTGRWGWKQTLAEMPLNAPEMARLLTRLSTRDDADLYLYSAPIEPETVDTFRSLLVGQSPRKANATVFVTTGGGDPDAGYRWAACLRRHYKRVRAYIFGPCKSAGTLALIGADEIVYGDFGELGPLDVQMAKTDEILTVASGLDIVQAVSVVTNSAWEAFEGYLLSLIGRSGGTISTKTASDIAKQLSVGIFAPMSAQIDPERLGEVQRAINIANAYGERLDAGHLKKDGLSKLVQGYPAHGFVINLVEARTIFNRVRAADPLETRIGNNLPWARRPGRTPVIIDLLKVFAQPKKVTRNVPASPRKARRAARATPARRSAGTGGNVAPLRADAAGDTASAAKDNNARSQTGREKGTLGAA